MNYYFNIHDQPVGPLDTDQIGQKISQGEIQLHTLAWKQGMASWAEVKNVPELLSSFPQLNKSAGMTPPPLPHQVTPPPLPSRTPINLEYVKYAVIGAGIIFSALILVAFMTANFLGVGIGAMLLAGIYQTHKYIEDGKLNDAKKFSLGTGIACAVLGLANFVLQAPTLALIEITAAVALFFAGTQLGKKAP